LGEIVCAVAAVIPLDNEKHWIIQAEFVVPSPLSDASNSVLFFPRFGQIVAPLLSM
jgi:hypothetical protein